MKKLITLLSILVGMSFAISAKDFPCISKPTENNECWVKFKDPRDKQEYLAIKRCRTCDSDSPVCNPIYACTISLVENSRFKSENAKCGKKDEFFHGCVYATDREAEKFACPKIGGLGIAKGCRTEDGYHMTYEINNDEYAKLRKDVLSGKDIAPYGVVMVMEDGRHTASPCTNDYWYKYDGKWGIGGHSRFENVYWRCEYWMSE